jgi:DNA modification methylase
LEVRYHKIPTNDSKEREGLLMGQIYKSVSFPRALNKNKETMVVKLAFGERDTEIAELIKSLESSQIRALLNNKSIEELQEKANYENRSLNKVCLLLIKDNLAKYKIRDKNQLDIFLASPSNSLDLDKPSVTFKNNKKRGIYNWYPYIEGFSYDFVETILDYVVKKPNFIYDPFAGTGTTVIVASQRNVRSGFSEINPFMRFIIETKINAISNFKSIIKSDIERVHWFLGDLKTNKSTLCELNESHRQLVHEGFFREDILMQMAYLKDGIHNSDVNQITKNILILALSALIVKESNMIRRADLRYKRDKEFEDIDDDVVGLFVSKSKSIFSDLEFYENLKVAGAELVSNDAKEIDNRYSSVFDLVVTSPPYVNGTNYFRNTKLELRLLDFIQNEDDLKNLRTLAITSGINNVSSRRKLGERLKYVEPIVKELGSDNYDSRIPMLVELYFSDMKTVFTNVHRVMRDDADLFIDIGDSKFKNVHVPTDIIYEKIAEDVGFELIEKRKVRTRFSKDGTPLGQWLLHLKKHKGYSRKNGSFQIYDNQPIFSTSGNFSPAELVRKNWESFRDQLPYLIYPYNKRNWGNAMHSLCSYQGKLKPAIAHFLIKYFTSEEMMVLDPLSGVGTIPLEAALQGRFAYGNDLSLLAYSNTLAKIGEKSKKECDVLLENLKEYIENNLPKDQDIESIDISFNQNLKEYYHRDTLKEIVAAREFFKNRRIKTPSEAAVFGSLLHILHGNRPYALSRTSHPITPFAPRGPFIYKSLIKKLREKINRVLAIGMSENYKAGIALWDDFMNLDKNVNPSSIDTIITSPPFYDSTRFYLANWIRMWFSGWDKEDFNIRKEEFLETKQVKDVRIYNIFFEKCNSVLKPNGSLILHLGFSKKANMAEMLIPLAQKRFKVVGYFNENVNNRENFGISDVGTVKMHQFLFLVKET